MAKNNAPSPTTRKRVHPGSGIETGDEFARKRRSKHVNSQEVHTPPKHTRAAAKC